MPIMNTRVAYVLRELCPGILRMLAHLARVAQRARGSLQ